MEAADSAIAKTAITQVVAVFVAASFVFFFFVVVLLLIFSSLPPCTPVAG
ncbi:hypothetical protein [Variovorax paradoxus]|nr:hypothetical protein [Variovorax paradoxus]